MIHVHDDSKRLKYSQAIQITLRMQLDKGLVGTRAGKIQLCQTTSLCN